MTITGTATARLTLATFPQLSFPTLFLLLLVFGFASPAAKAHRLNLTTSDIVWQPAESALDITHRLHLDDALTLLARLGADDGVLDLAASARLMNYLTQRFQLVTRDTTLTLEPFGAHIDNGVLYVYQRALVTTLPPALEVTNTILHELVADTQNQVNWRVGDIVRSHLSSSDQPVCWLKLATNSTYIRNNQNNRYSGRDQ